MSDGTSTLPPPPAYADLICFSIMLKDPPGPAVIFLNPAELKRVLRLSSLARRMYARLFYLTDIRTGLPDDDQELARIAGVPIGAWRRRRPILIDLFHIVDGCWLFPKACFDADGSFEYLQIGPDDGFLALIALTQEEVMGGRLINDSLHFPTERRWAAELERFRRFRDQDAGGSANA